MTKFRDGPNDAINDEILELVVVRISMDDCELAAKVDTRLKDLLSKNDWHLIATEKPEYGRVVVFYAPTDISNDGVIRNWKKASGYLMRGYLDEPDYFNWDGRRMQPYEAQPTHWHHLPEGP